MRMTKTSWMVIYLSAVIFIAATGTSAEETAKTEASRIEGADSQLFCEPPDARYRCELIIVAEYIRYSATREITYSDGTRAYYYPIKILTGPPLSRKINLKYDFYDKSGQSAPDGWKFDEAMMPVRGSKWILFIPHATPNEDMFETFQGSIGRVEYNKKNIEEVEDRLSCSGLKFLMDKH